VEQLQPSFKTTFAEDGSCTRTVPFSSVSLGNTSIEIYNYIVNVIRSGPTFGSGLQKRPHVHPLSLDVCKAIERVLDSGIGRWRGKVTIRNGSDLPTCPACQYEGEIPENQIAEYEPSGAFALSPSA
jgi:hypothetical protein